MGIRIFDHLGISYYVVSGGYVRDKMADDDLIFRHKPSWEKRYGGVLYTHYERGLRDRPILPKAKDEYRILALGDSVTLGAGVEQHQIFTSRLEHLLSGRLQRSVRVINSGVGGYNTVQEVTYFKKEGIALQPDLVLLTYIGNDIETNRGPFNPWAGPTIVQGYGDEDAGEALVLSVGASHLSLCGSQPLEWTAVESIAGWGGVAPVYGGAR